MNATYLRYRTDPAFRDALADAARRERNRAIASFIAVSAAYFARKGHRHAARPHLAHQG